MANAEYARHLIQNPNSGRSAADQKHSRLLSKLWPRRSPNTNTTQSDSPAWNVPESDKPEQEITSSEIQYPIIERKLEQRWELRPIQISDVPKIALWFRDQGVRDHIGEDRIDPYIPKNWNNVREIGKFNKKLEEFYFPPEGKVKVEVKTPPHQIEDGETIPTTDPKNPTFLEVTQYTHVCTINGKLVGVQSWMSDDPYAPIAVRKEIDEGRDKAAYGFVMITNPEYRRLHVATVMSLARNDLVLGKDESHPGSFTHISGLVSRKNGWQDIFNFFRDTLGYEFDKDPDGHGVPQIINGKQEEFFRMVLGRRKWWRIRDQVYADLERKMNPREDESSKTV